MDQNVTDHPLTTDAIAARRRRRRRGLVVLMLSLSIASLGAGAFSLALFTDQATVGANAFNTGTIDLTTNPTTALLTNSAMFPGDAVNGTLLVTNAGTGALRYSMTTANTNATLAAGLTLQVKTVGTGCANFDGTDVVASVALNGAANGFGSSATGAQTGDRSLAVGASETLCFRVTLPLTADNTYQNLSNTATFTFDAEQTKNN
jgi:hypothetical protein